MDWVKLVYKPVARRAAHRAIRGRVRDLHSPEKGRFTRADVDNLLKAAWHSYDTSAPSLPKQPTWGSTMNVHLACFTLSMLETLLARATERAYAIELIADATWNVYQLWARVASLVARVMPWRSTTLAFASHKKNSQAGTSLRFPFNAPGYLIEPVSSASGVAFDVVHCPIASYFRERGAADLCVASWCNLDYPLAEITHQKLVRTETLVEGARRCDFRVLPADRETVL
jgi:ubiquinone biosynthesis protein